VAVGVAGGGDVGGSAEDVGATEALVERVHVGHAVEQREDGGLGSNGWGDGVHRGGEVVGLATEEDELVGGGLRGGCERFGNDGWRRRKGEIAKGAGEVEAFRGEERGGTRADEEGYVAMRGKEAGSEVAAERSGAQNESSHGSILRGRGSIGCGDGMMGVASS
jgi:hypothetical protein